ncbi:rhomboid family intramembrane serine protease [Paracrocinitomix mangrovi]|uniref:rhomboid family intramembrane serine protease n=1 Tax=Paracrocinitomix mangrovi TaxID=2862509 RepID=UPI001C8ECCC9|nr:rhomboid family intramembrane serine protease [Paracrocinitomix mangrovi]UKN00631.1 rhomboid family intramembrane serine protease [Paracrocinitomix mangrovi]
MFQLKITRISFGIALSLVALMWAVFAIEYALDLDWYKYGIYPRTAKGLIGIITSPFLHSTRDFAHIINNSVPTLILTWMMFYHYRTIAAQAFVFIYLFTGATIWLFAHNGYHIGMSGVIYGMTSFLITSGFLRRNMRVAAVSLVVVFLYGSTVWGIFPNQPGVSWEAHAFGFIGGIMIALFYRKNGPQPKKLMYEIEEDLGIEPEEEYWKEGYQPKQQEAAPKIIINYQIVPEKPKVETEESNEVKKKN